VVQIHSLCSCSCSRFQIGRRFEFPSIPSNNEDLDGNMNADTPAREPVKFMNLSIFCVATVTNQRPYDSTPWLYLS